MPTGAFRAAPRAADDLERRSVKRWLAVSLGLGAALLALYALATRRPAPPLDDIDAASRAKLEQVLREKDTPPVEPR
jgi:hypothetical protein